MNALLKQFFAVLRFTQRILNLAENKTIPLLKRLRFLAIFGAHFEELMALRLMRLKKENVPILKLKNASFLLYQHAELILNQILKQLPISKNISQHPESLLFYQNKILPILQNAVLFNKNFYFKNNQLQVIFKENSQLKIASFPPDFPLFLTFNQNFIFLSDLIQHFQPNAHLFFSLSNLFINIPLPLNINNFQENLHNSKTILFYINHSKTEDILKENGFYNAFFYLSKNNLIPLTPLKNFFSFLPLLENNQNKNLKHHSLPDFPKHSFDFLNYFHSFHSFNFSYLFNRKKQKDYLIYYPYHHFDLILNLLQWAAWDEKVSHIFISIYRTATPSKIIQNLILAAKKGKKILVCLELLARQDEENNFQLYKILKENNIEVFIPQNGIKLHAKTFLIQRENQFLTHISTGNYNENTAKQYIDIGILSNHQNTAKEILFLFQNHFKIDYQQHLKKLNFLSVAPYFIHSQIMRLIQQESAFAKQKKRAKIIAKINALTEPKIIQALKDAAENGVQIRLIVRGASLLKPQKNIQIISVLGDFLEHSRLIYFYHNGKEKCYISSADWMPRNLFQRIELLYPIFDKKIKRFLIQNALQNYFKSSHFEMQKNGHYIFKEKFKNAQIEPYFKLLKGL